ncbi:hypothetical protein GCM10007108_13310 [Thermogymnomonas acidicola]|uniref:Uncharacterized protein n=2 Tax=Thermogymnomonas acidicola TaxID=399579 RepID=A0AA37F9V9_9ARCH|nr:hypothetical protein GCM10007108_13310 [Thermogymnomonas acidicola]
MILFALVFQPYGPLNASSQDDYHLSAIKSYNYTVYENMLKVASLIPKNVSASEILVENNIPFIFPRVDSYGLNVSNPLTAPLEVDYNYNFFYNFTELGPDGEYIPIVPEYIIMYPYGGMYNQGYWGYAGTDGPYPHNISNAALIDHLVSTHHYGMVAEASGIFLLELNYSGPLRFYVPFNYYYPPNYFNTYPDSSLTMAGITGTDIRNGGLFWGQTVLLPGTYNITFSFTGTSQSSNNSLILNVAHDNGLIDLASRTIYPHNLTSLDNFNVTFTVSTERILAYTIYSVWVPNWEGTITFTGIHVTQIKPPGQN